MNICILGRSRLRNIYQPITKSSKYNANMCNSGFRASADVYSGFQKAAKYVGHMCILDLRAHPSVVATFTHQIRQNDPRRVRTCPRTTPEDAINDPNAVSKTPKTWQPRPIAQPTSHLPRQGSRDYFVEGQAQPTSEPTNQRSRAVVSRRGGR